MPTISPAKSFLKFLDQPQLIHRLEKAVPWALPATGAAVVLHDTFKAEDGNKKKTFIKGAIGMGATIAFALGGVKLFGEAAEHGGAKAIDAAVKAFKKDGGILTKPLARLIEKTKTGILAPKDVHALQNGLLKAGKNGEHLFEELIPSPHAHTALEILKEIGKLSMLGLMPVAGGVVGGMVANKVAGEDWKKGFKNQSKEGLYQFLANIFLCNVGAGVALGIQERTPFQGRAARLVAMSLGILAFGVIGGNCIANFVGKNLFNPLCDKGPAGLKDVKDKIRTQGVGSLFKDLNAERHPEAVDVGLHIDDFATVGVLAGMKWIAPALPFLYSLSGYRAMIGYRNGKVEEPSKKLEISSQPDIHINLLRGTPHQLHANSNPLYRDFTRTGVSSYYYAQNPTQH